MDVNVSSRNVRTSFAFCHVLSVAVICSHVNFDSMSFCPLQVVDSKATVKRTTKPRRSSRTLNVENGSELSSTVNGRATSGPNGEQENRGLYGLVICHILVIIFASKAFFFRFVFMSVILCFELERT